MCVEMQRQHEYVGVARIEWVKTTRAPTSCTIKILIKYRIGKAFERM